MSRIFAYCRVSTLEQTTKNHGYHYLVVSRKRKRLFDESEATLAKDLPNQQVRVQRIFNEETDEIELYCHLQAREEKERAIQNQFSECIFQTIVATDSSDGCHPVFGKCNSLVLVA